MGPRTGFFLVCASLALAFPAAARPFVFLYPEAGAMLHPDERVEVRWNGTPADVEELELLLSLDGGRSYAIRLTEQLEGDAGAWTWKVPGLPSREVRLAIRMRLDGREVEGAQSPVFEIAPTATFPSWSLEPREGELWLIDRPVPPDAFPLSPPALVVATPGLTPQATETVLPAPRVPMVGPPAAVRGAAIAPGQGRRPLAAPGVVPHRPFLEVPLRT